MLRQQNQKFTENSDIHCSPVPLTLSSHTQATAWYLSNVSAVLTMHRLKMESWEKTGGGGGLLEKKVFICNGRG